MADCTVKIIDLKSVTHAVISLKFEKPKGYSFTPGQAADVAINKPNYINEKRPLTFTGLNEWDYLEFTIKNYNDHNGVTKEIGNLKTGGKLIVSEP